MTGEIYLRTAEAVLVDKRYSARLGFASGESSGYSDIVVEVVKQAAKGANPRG